MRNKLFTRGLAIIGALVLQYAIGMFVDLFVEFPEGQVGNQLWGFAWTQVPLALHILLAFFILFAAIVQCVQSVRAKDSQWKIASTIGLIAIFIAFGSGASFIPSQNDLYSYSMALAFIVAILAYGWGVSARRTTDS